MDDEDSSEIEQAKPQDRGKIFEAEPQQNPEDMSEADRRWQRDLDEWNNTANWRLGVFYTSKRDSRIWVPKRNMFGRPRSGGTPNLAKPQARKILAMLIGGFVLFLMLLTALENAGVLP